MAVTEGKVSVAEGTGKNLETTTVTTGAGTVEREVVVLGDPETPGARTRVTNAAPAAADYGPAVRVGDGHDVAQGATTDAEAIDAGTEIAVLKRIRTLETSQEDLLNLLLGQARMQTRLLLFVLHEINPSSDVQLEDLDLES